MSPHDLPDRPSLEYLKKVAKERLRLLRASDPGARLAQAQLAIAREYGFPSWRALKTEIDRRREPQLTEFFRASADGVVDRVRELLHHDASLAGERTAQGHTALHLAVEHPDVVRLLLEHGADPNAREKGDNVTPLHVAAANKVLESVRLLIDAGADVHGHGDLHDGDVIGWATAPDNHAVMDLLLAHGARHHIFSAMATRNRDLVQHVVEEQPESLSRRRSRFENGQTVVHAAFAPPDGQGFLAGAPDYEMLRLLIDLGADVDATDDKGRTPLAIATLRGDREAMAILRSAGAHEEPDGDQRNDRIGEHLKSAGTSVKGSSPMFRVPDMRATVAWYESIGFTVADRYEDSGELTFARITFGGGEFALTGGSDAGPRDVSLWFFTDRIQELYELFKRRQRASLAASADAASLPDVGFEQDLYEPFYGGRQFDVRDCNGLSLIFWQPPWLSSGAATTASS
jgi:ankyrin repeat protein